MRILLACGSCQRQFDASGRAPGERFRCSCGSLLTVPEPRGHEAAVVRCSACGAPRLDASPACAYCGADFTLHERDLHTLCPRCLARISDRARFCHHCGVAVMPQGDAGEATDRLCPACGDGAELVSRSLGGEGLSVLECGRCAGLWLGSEVFRRLEGEAKTQAGSLFETAPLAVFPSRDGGPLYRPCPFCGKLMHRRNYGAKSGVILDQCHEHGLWFDAGELERVLSWIGDGGLARSERLAAEEAKRRRRQQRLSRRVERGESGDMLGGGAPSGPALRTRDALGDSVLDFVGHLLSRLWK